jgi:hypothetical protein
MSNSKGWGTSGNETRSRAGDAPSSSSVRVDHQEAISASVVSARRTLSGSASMSNCIRML